MRYAALAGRSARHHVNRLIRSLCGDCASSRFDAGDTNRRLDPLSQSMHIFETVANLLVRFLFNIHHNRPFR